MRQFKGFKSERHYHNCKLHGLAVVITGEDEANDYLKLEVAKIIESRSIQPDIFEDVEESSSGVKQLTDPEAKELYHRLIKVAHTMKRNIDTARELAGTSGNEMTIDQRKRIIKLTKYVFNWSVQVTFSKITEYCPKLLKRMTPWQIENCKIGVLYSLMTKAQASVVIKRLMSIEKRNKELTNS